jgi:hypothetical protein
MATQRAMKEHIPTNDSVRNPNHNLPPIGKGVRVKYNGHECLAYLDGQGKWRNYDTGEPLSGEVTILRVD